jgi:bifunctional ADP-heptose synthase (sugar kinase/adenylyltransferase)
MEYTAFYREGWGDSVKTHIRRSGRYAHTSKKSYATEIRKNGYRVVTILSDEDIKAIKGREHLTAEEEVKLMVKYGVDIVDYVTSEL